MSKKNVTKSYAIGDKFGAVDAQSVAQDFFGAGYVPEARVDADEGEKLLAVSMRLLGKTSTTTKQRALSDINRGISLSSDAIIAGYLYNYIDIVNKHLFHEDPRLRCSIFKTLAAFVKDAGKETKRQLVQELGGFMSSVLFGMHDPDSSVCKAASEVLENCFPDQEKRSVALKRSFDEVSSFIVTQLESTKGCSAIKNDDEEKEAFSFIMSFGTVGFLLVNHPEPSVIQPFALDLLKKVPIGHLRRCLPSDPSGPVKLVASAPKLRAAAFSLLTAIIAVTAPIPPRDYDFIWVCCMQGITDPQPAVVFVAWQMTLKWIERFKKDAVDSMPDGFVGLVLTQIDSLSVRDSGNSFEALLSSLLPLIAVISREERHAGVVDDVCGTLVEKIKGFSARPNSREYYLIWKTLWECWELHLLRKTSRGEAAHSLELLAVIMAVIVEQATTTAPLNSARLWQAFEKDVSTLASTYVLRAAQRPETNVSAEEILMTLIDEAKQFKVISHPKDRVTLYRFASFVASRWLKSSGDALKDTTRPLMERWLIAVFDKLLYVCEATVPADGEDEATLSDNKEMGFVAIGQLVKALAEGGDAGSPLIMLSDDLKRRIVKATAEWSQFATALAPFLFRAERIGGTFATSPTGESASQAVTKFSPVTANSPSPDVTSTTAKSIIDKISSEPLETASEADVKVLTVAVESDSVSSGDMLELFRAVAPHRLFIDCAAALLKGLSRRPPAEGLGAHASSICETVRLSITAVWEKEEVYREGARGHSSLMYDNEAPSDSDSSSDSSTSTDGSESDSDADSDSSAASSSSSEAERDDKNCADDVREGLIEWMEIISDESFAVRVLPNTEDGSNAQALEARKALTEPIAKALLLGIASISPLLHIEQFASLRYLRSAMPRVELALESQTFLYSVVKKKNHLKSEAFDSLLALFCSTCEEELLLGEKDLSSIVTSFFDQYIYNKACWSEQLSGTSHLEDFLSLASSPLHLVSGKQLLDLAKPHMGLMVRRTDTTSDVIGLHQMAGTVESLAGVMRLGQIAAAVAKDSAARKELFSARPLDVNRIATLVVALTAVVYLRLTLSDGVTKAAREALHDALLSLPAQQCAQSDEEGAHAVWMLAMQTMAQHHLLPCLAEVIADLYARYGIGGTDADSSTRVFSRKCVLSAASEWFVTKLSKDQQMHYAEAFQSFLERSGVLNSPKDRSIIVSKVVENTMRAAFKAPTTAFPVAVSYLMIFRGTQDLVAITDDEITALGMRCHKPDDEVKALALICELMCANNGNPSLYTELCRMTTQSATKNYTLAQLPSNGKLNMRPQTVVPPSLDLIQPTILALAKASRGMAMHRKRDDILRSTINLVVFDSVCDAVSRLRAATSAALSVSSPTASAAAFSSANIVNARNTSLAVLVGFVAKAYRYIATLQASDIASIGASENAVAVISSTLASVYTWVCASTVAQIEAIGLSNVLEVVSCVNTLALVALNQSPAPITSMIHLVRKKLLVKGARILHAERVEDKGKLTTATSVKMPFFKKLYNDVERTTKQKTSLLSWLTSWACTLTNKRFSLEEGSGVDRSELVRLFDIAMALLLCPYTVKGGKGRVDDTFLFVSADQLAPEDTGFSFRPQVLGKLQTAAAMHTSKRMGQVIMGVLARGAASVLTLAIQSPALPALRDWLETLDSSVRVRFLSFAEEHMCPIIIQTSLVGVLQHSPTGEMSFEVDDGYTVRLDMDRRYLSLQFTFEDVASSLDITLPKTYPIVVSADMVKPTVQGSGKQAVQMRTWCMKMSMTLFNGEAQSMWDAVEMFGKNMKSYLEGVEPCPICYCVMSSKRTIPDMGCSVCRNKCHKVCLNKWWASTGNCTCPYCRSPWVV